MLKTTMVALSPPSSPDLASLMSSEADSEEDDVSDVGGVPLTTDVDVPTDNDGSLLSCM